MCGVCFFSSRARLHTAFIKNTHDFIAKLTNLCFLTPPTLVPSPPPTHHFKFSPGSPRIDARAATLRALHTLCLSCWPRLHAHSSKLLCALLWACADCSRRASARELADDGAASVGAAIACSAIDASADESVREHATRLGALILVLTGDPARSTLQEVCAAVSVVRPVGCAMEKLADRPLEGLESAGE